MEFENKPGQMAIVGLIFLLFVAMITATLFARTAGFLRFGSNDIRTEQAVHLAEAGVDHALWKLQTNSNYTGESTPVPVGTNFGEFKTTVTEDSSTKAIVSTGCMPDCTSPISKQIVKVDATNNPGGQSTTTINLNPYIVQVGDKGIYMFNSIINGPVYSNANAISSGVCAASGYSASICLTQSTDKINGNATAAWNICKAPFPPCLGTINGVVSQNQSQLPLPDLKAIIPPDTTSKLDQIKTGAAMGGIISCQPCDIPPGDWGPKKYDAKYTSFNVDKSVNLKGPIYITNCPSYPIACVTFIGATITVDPSVGSVAVPIVVDGVIHINELASPNISGGYPLIISTSDSTNTTTGCINVNTNLNNFPILFAPDCFVTTTGLIGFQVAFEVIARGLRIDSSVVNSGSPAPSPLSSLTISTGSSPGSWKINKGSYRYSAN